MLLPGALGFKTEEIRRTITIVEQCRKALAKGGGACHGARTMKATSAHLPSSTIEPLESRIAPAGLVKVSLVGDLLTITGDEAGNEVTVNVLANGTTDIVPAGGTDIFFNGATTAATLNVTAAQPKLVSKLGIGDDKLTTSGVFTSITADNGDGANTTTLGTMTVIGKTMIKGGKDTDSVVTLAGAGAQKFLGDFSMRLGEGNNVVSVTAGSFNASGNFSIINGNGNNTIVLTPTASATSFNLSFAKNVTFTSGTGSHVTVLGSAGIYVGGKTTIALKDITNSTFVNATSKCVFAGPVNFLCGPGSDTIVLINGTGDQLLDFGAGLNMNTGAGNGSTIVIACSSAPLKISGPLTATSTGKLFVTTLVSPNLILDGALTIRGGADSTFTIQAAGTISGKATLSTGTFGMLNMSNTSLLTFAGGLTVDFSKTTSANGITISNILTNGPLKILGGSAVDTIKLDNIEASGAVSIVTGKGNDILDVERTAVGAAASSFLLPFVVSLGAGDDTASIGNNNANLKITTFAGFKVDGGIGNDTLSLATNANVLLRPPTVIGIEVGS